PRCMLHLLPRPSSGTLEASLVRRHTHLSAPTAHLQHRHIEFPARDGGRPPEPTTRNLRRATSGLRISAGALPNWNRCREKGNPAGETGTREAFRVSRRCIAPFGY